MKKLISVLFLLTAMTTAANAKQFAGVDIELTATVAGQTLSLNGAGIRTKFVFDVYVAALYTAAPVKKSADLNMNSPMRMLMHFVYDEVSKEKLVDAWNDGFEDNLKSADLKKLEDKIKQFNAMFETVKKGDVVLLDFDPASGTSVTINDVLKGKVEGADFYRALMLIWIGEDPVTDNLKNALLGIKSGDDD